MSTRQLTDDAEDVVNTYAYDAFGITLDQAGVVANNYLYTGEQYDGNVGFYYLRARYYNQDVGRFTTQDTWQGNIFEPVSIHKYLYANANPVLYSDPSGKVPFSVGSVMTTIGISYALSSMIVPNISLMLAKARGNTDRFTIQFFAGGSVGKLLYFGAIDAYIFEEPHSKTNKIPIPRRRGLFTVYLIGFGVGAGATIASQDTTFKTPTNRKIQDFAGYGRISAVEAAYQGLGGVSLAEMQMPDGTQIPLRISFGAQISSGLTAYVAYAVFHLNFIDNILK
jgi:RHS repeat-associated protein